MSKINLPKRVDLKKQRDDLRTNGMIVPLPYTSVGSDDTYTIKMRYVSAFDKSVVEAMPQHAQEQVWAGIQGIQKSARSNRDPESLMESVLQNESQLRAADLLFCAASLEPAVVMTEAEAGEDDYPVESFAAEDRISFLMGTLGGNQEIAKTFKLFRPNEGGNVQNGQAVELAESAPVRVMEPAE